MRQSVFNKVYYHFIWTTKNHQPIISVEIEDAIKRVLYSKAKELHLDIVEINGTDDHVHILIHSTPSIAPSDIVKHFKGSSSHFINHITLKNDKTRTFYWQDGYGIVTISPSAVKSVKKYIKNQKVHHSQRILNNELEYF
ncbi:MAG: IS200/IS605 family transposase [Bacteroidetes bacterium]|nr:IS200/IS605 family transposase [Bacteroidota bacterium]